MRSSLEFLKEARIFGARVPEISPEQMQYAPESVHAKMHPYFRVKSKENVTHPALPIGAGAAGAGATLAAGALAAGALATPAAPLGALAALPLAARIGYAGVRSYLRDKAEVRRAQDHMEMGPAEQEVHSRASAADVLAGRRAAVEQRTERMDRQSRALAKKQYKLQRKMSKMRANGAFS